MRKLLSVALAVTFGLTLGACQDGSVTSPAQQPASEDPAANSAIPVVHPEIPVVNVTATSEHASNGEDGEHRFDMDRKEIPAGWTTFRFHNEADVTHFMVLQRLPEVAGDVTREEYIEQVSKTAQEFLNLFFAGEQEEAFAKLGELPSWLLAPGPTTMGGPGLTAGGHTSVTTMKLTPGRYVAECYVRDEDSNVQHSAHGMVEVFTVTEPASGAPEPSADVKVDITTAENGGIEVSSSRLSSAPPGDGPTLRPGAQTIAVHFEDQTGYPFLSGHDVHLVRLDDSADLSELNSWMYWVSPEGEGLRAPSPAGATFLGGTQQMPEGQTAYVTTVLPADRYGMIAEVPDPQGKGMLETFTLPSGKGAGK